MKYLLYFKENSNNFNTDIVFENDDWMIIKPSSYESCCYWGQDTEWRVSDGDHEYYFDKDGSYIVIKKDNPLFPNMNDKYFLNFHSGDFEDKDEDKIYLKDFLDKDPVLYNFFGEQIECPNVKEQNGQYWIVVDDYDFFVDHFRLDRDTRNDLIKIVLGGDYFDLFNYELDDFSISDMSVKLIEANLLLLKIVLRLEKDKNEYDYDLNDINDYDDIVSVVKEFHIKSLEKAIQGAFCEAQEGADGSAAWEDIVDEIYRFFDLEEGSAKWEKTEGFKYDALWIRFKSKSDAIKAKFALVNFDDSFDDDSVINYSPPYNGYYGKSEVVEEGFNNCIENKIDWYYDKYSEITSDEINSYYKYWEEEKKKNPKATDDQIAKEVQFFLDAKKYNL